MTEKETIVALILLLLIIILNGVATYKAFRYYWNDAKRRRMNILLIWLIPVFWSLLIIVITAKPGKARKDDKYRYLEAGYKGWTRYWQ